jgi:hypothetical protein
VAARSIKTLLSGKDGHMKVFCGYNICWIHFSIYSTFNFIDLNIDWNWYSTNNKQQNIILCRHFGKDCSKSIHQKGVFKWMTDKHTEMRKDKRQFVYL